jgi:hypothetical protein
MAQVVQTARMPRLARSLLAVVVLAAAVAGAPEARAATTETFTSPTWWRAHGFAAAPWNTEVVEDASGNPFLRVHIDRGHHDGTSFLLPTGSADHVRLTYRIRFDAAFDPSRADHNVKLPGFGKPVFSATGECLAGCGGAPADGVIGYSARSQVDETGTPGFYVYDTSFHRWGSGYPWDAAPLAPARWHTVDLEIWMNHPMRDDGRLEATLDGAKVFSADDLHFRWTDALHVGGAWFDFYYGGAGVSPASTAIDIDDVVIAT